MEQYLGWVDAKNRQWQDVRAHYFAPVLRLFTKYKITANVVTNFRLILGIVGVLLYLWFYRYMWGLNLLFIANLLDILDGALARFQHTASDRGKFLDVFVDYVLYAFMLLFVYVISYSNKIVGYNLFIIPVLYLLATIKKQEFLPSDWLIKVYPRVTYVKAAVFIAFFGHWYLNFDLVWIDRALKFSNGLATILCVYYFLYIQLRWKKMKA